MSTLLYIFHAHQIPPNLHFASPRAKQIKSKTKQRDKKNKEIKNKVKENPN